MDWRVFWELMRVFLPMLFSVFASVMLIVFMLEAEQGTSGGYALLAGLRSFRFLVLKPWYILQCKLYYLFHKHDPADPFLAYKQALMVVDNQGKVVGFSPLTGSHIHKLEGIVRSKKEARFLYGVEDIAQCTLYNHRDCPSESCRCGFYALKLRKLVNKVFGSWVHASRLGNFAVVTLDVELYGKVIEGSLGFRAEKQSVLKIHCKNRCGFCADAKKYPFFCKKAVAFDSFGSHKLVGQLYYLVPVCQNHKTSHSKTLQDVANDLGTEVVWQ